MSEPDSDLAAIFRDEARGRLEEMDTALLRVEAGQAGPEMIDGLFRNAHTIKGAAGMLGFDDIQTLAHAVEDVLGDVRAAGVFPTQLAGPLLHATQLLLSLVEGADEPIDDVLDELATSRRGLEREAGPKRPAGEPPGERPPPPRPERPRGTLRVPAEKIDHLLDVVGEVMQDRRRLAHALSERADLRGEVADALGSGDRMLEELKDTAVGLRTLPLAVITGPLPRAVRDLARAAGKEVEFTVAGADTELDRVILESLSEPLTHLLRNAVDHGIEPPAERDRVGKPPRGRIALRAEPRGGLVEVVVADDGRGVTPEIADEAREAGSLVDVLTRPGFSTSREVTELGGRGVGLDAVKAYVQSLGGSLDIRSQPGHGTEVALLVPLALALLEVLLLRRGASVYGVPLAVVEEVVTVAETVTLGGRRSMAVRGRSLPVVDVAEVLGAPASAPVARPPALVVSAGGRRAVVICDRLLGQEEVSVKPLGPMLSGIRAFLGSALLSDGAIALLIQPSVLTSPARPVEAEPARRMAEPPQRPATPPKVLVVEDSFTVRELQRSILEAAGYAVATARDGRDALAVLAREPEVALVVTDLEMPDLDGLGLTRQIRADPARSSLPVVVVTSHGTDEDRRQGIEAGADAFMVKREFNQQALLATVERLIGR